MKKLRSAASAGQQVDVRGEPWLVVQSEPFDECVLVTLRGIGDRNLGETTRLLSPFDRLSVRADSDRLRVAPHATVVAAAARAVARSHRWDDTWTAATSRIDLLPWQLEPAVAAISGSTRMLLADAVGLGKTIQAALVLTELRARGLSSRALILAPASLREQWAAELRDRFHVDAIVFDQATIARLVASLPADVNPWTTADVIVSSLDLVKRPEIRAAVDRVPFDLLIVDEAHHLTPGTDRGSLVAALASRIPWIVLATATPHSGDESAYAFLQSLGVSGPGDGLRVFRRGSDDVDRRRDRHVHLHRVTATRLEQQLVDETMRYAKAVWGERTRDGRLGLVSTVIARRLVSSAYALGRTLQRRRALLSTTTVAMPAQTSLPWDEHDSGDDVEMDDVLSAGALADSAAETEWLERLIALTALAQSASSKWRLINRLLARTGEPAIVFSEYRDSIDDLRVRVHSVASVAVVHGGLSARERRAAIQDFCGGRARVLLATDTAGEGLNLQARCRLVINLELPWNPLRLEQRVGRVDRIGQTRRVHAIHLCLRGSFEEYVLARLERRSRAASVELQATVDETFVARAVFDSGGSEPEVIRVPVFHDECPSSQAASHAVLSRRASTLAARHRGLLQPVCSARAARLASGSLLVFEWDLTDGRGRLVARELAAVSIGLSRLQDINPLRARWLIERLRDSTDVRHALQREVDRRFGRQSRVIREAATRIERRLHALVGGIERVRAPAFQASLFDRRAEQQALAAEAAIARWRAHLERRIDAARSLRVLSASRPRLIAAWPF